MEDLLREAFQLGQQWVQDMNNDQEPTDFNTWYNSDDTQERVKNCSIPAVVGQSEQLKAFNCVNFEDEHGICKEQCDYCKRVKGF
jgi:hypothetical protein